MGFFGYLVPGPFLSPYSYFPFAHEETSCLLHNFVSITFLPPSAWGLATRNWINPPKTWTKICNSSFKLFLSGTLVIMVKKVTNWYSPRLSNIYSGLHLQKPKGRQECYVYCGAGNGRVFRQNILESSCKEAAKAAITASGFSISWILSYTQSCACKDSHVYVLAGHGTHRYLVKILFYVDLWECCRMR